MLPLKQQRTALVKFFRSSRLITTDRVVSGCCIKRFPLAPSPQDVPDAHRELLSARGQQLRCSWERDHTVTIAINIEARSTTAILHGVWSGSASNVVIRSLRNVRTTA